MLANFGIGTLAEERFMERRAVGVNRCAALRAGAPRNV